MRHNLLPHPQAITANGQSIGVNCEAAKIKNSDVIFTVDKPMKQSAGFVNLKGNLFDSAIMKTSVISPSFSERYLSNPDDPNAFEGTAFVFDGPEDFHKRIDDESLNMDAQSILVMRGAGPIGYPGGAEVVNMRPPAYLIKQGVSELPCIGDGRQSGTSGSPSILNASPEAAAGGGLALLQTGDRIRVDMNNCSADILVMMMNFRPVQKSWPQMAAFLHRKARAHGSNISAKWSSLFQKVWFCVMLQIINLSPTKGVPRDNH